MCVFKGSGWSRRSCSLQGQDQRSLPPVIAMLTQKDSLPRPQAKSSLADRNRHRTAQHRCLHMRGHVVGPFTGVDIRKVFGSNVVERRFQVARDIGVGILVDRQRCGSVLDVDVQQSNLNRRQFRHRIQDVRRDQMKTATERWERQSMLKPAHATIAR